jgi:hypothetical protein
MNAFMSILQRIMQVMPVAVQTAETVGTLLAPGQKTGAQKSAAVQQIVTGAILGSDIMAGHEIIAPDAFNAAIAQFTTATVAILNSIKAKPAAV